MKTKTLTLLIAGLAFQSQAATVFTTSPTTKGALPVAVTEVGGIVTDLVGLNGNRVVAQFAASSLYVGFAGANPETIGTQTGFTPAVLAALGGGIAEAAFRISLFDGDTAAGNFDFNDNTFFVNGALVGNFSGVSTTNHDGTGTILGSTQPGFMNNLLGTGFFYTTNAAVLSSIYTAVSGTGSLQFEFFDTDPFDNFYDFTQGIDATLINVGVPPVVSVIPEPGSSLALVLLFSSSLLLRNRRKA